MDVTGISSKIYDLYRTGQEEVLHGFLLGLLQKFRPQAMEALEQFFPRVDGKGRLKVLEVLIEDGQEDLIPLFIDRIIGETNRLFAKSMLLLYSQFEHYEALEAISDIEDRIPGELKPAYQRVISKFSARFREHFYMGEFRSGVAKRTMAAANNMLKEPNPQYIPFLNNIIMHEESLVRSEGVRVLAEIGDLSSIDALFALIEKILGQIRLGEKLAMLINAVVKKDYGTREILLRKILAFQEEELDFAEFEEILRNKITRAKMDALLRGYQISADHFLRECIQNFEKVLAGLSPSNADLKRFSISTDSYMDNLHQFLLRTFRALGQVAHRNDEHEILSKVERLLPEEEKERDRCLIAVLGGYRAENAQELLVRYINESEDPKIQADVMAALEFYQLDQIPEGVKRLLTCAETSLRRQALQLVGKWNCDLTCLDALLQHESLSVVADAITGICEFKLESYYDPLVSMLESEIANSLKETIIRGLVAFPQERTGTALVSFLGYPGVYGLRHAALASLFHAGGPGRFQLITDAFKSYPKRHLAEIVGSFLDLCAQVPFSEFADEFDTQMEFWEYVFGMDNEKFRLKMLSLFEACQWPNAHENGKTWIAMIQRVLHARVEFRRTGYEERKLRVLIHVINNRIEEGPQGPRKIGKEHNRDELEALMELIDSGNHVDQVNAVRRLSLFFRPSMLENDKVLTSQLCDTVAAFLDRNMGANDLLVLGIGLAGKIGDDQLCPILERFVKHENKLVSRAARKVLHLDESDRSSQTVIRSVVVLDPSRYILKQLAKVLIQAGYKVETASEVRVALELISDRKPDLLITEMVLPGIEAWALLEMAERAGCKPEHTIVITSNRDQDSIQRMITKGVDGLLYKPFPMNKLLEKIKKLELH